MKYLYVIFISICLALNTQGAYANSAKSVDKTPEQPVMEVHDAKKEAHVSEKVDQKNTVMKLVEESENHDEDFDPRLILF